MIDQLSRLYELCERETELVAAGDIDVHELRGISEERTAIVAALPSEIPAAQQAALQQVVAQHQVTLAVLHAERDRIGGQMHQAGRRGRAARGYAAGLAAPDGPILDGVV